MGRAFKDRWTPHAARRLLLVAVGVALCLGMAQYLGSPSRPIRAAFYPSTCSIPSNTDPRADRSDWVYNANDYQNGQEYRLHMWWVGHFSCTTVDQGNDQRDEYGYELGADSRNCDGCAYDNVAEMQNHARVWACGVEKLNDAFETTGQAYVGISQGSWDYGANTYSSSDQQETWPCGPQADVTINVRTPGGAQWDKYLHENDAS